MFAFRLRLRFAGELRRLSAQGKPANPPEHWGSLASRAVLGDRGHAGTRGQAPPPGPGAACCGGASVAGAASPSLSPETAALPSQARWGLRTTLTNPTCSRSQGQPQHNCGHLSTKLPVSWVSPPSQVPSSWDSRSVGRCVWRGDVSGTRTRETEAEGRGLFVRGVFACVCFLIRAKFAQDEISEFPVDTLTVRDDRPSVPLGNTPTPPPKQALYLPPHPAPVTRCLVPLWLRGPYVSHAWNPPSITVQGLSTS